MAPRLERCLVKCPLVIGMRVWTVVGVLESSLDSTCIMLLSQWMSLS